MTPSVSQNEVPQKAIEKIIAPKTLYLATQLSKLFSSSTSNNIDTNDELESQLVDEEIPHINKLKGRNDRYSKIPAYYPKHTPLDLLFEEKGKKSYT